MADWNTPTIDSLKVDVLDILKLRDIDAVSLAETPTNPPVGAKRWNNTDKLFQLWDGAGWTDLVLSVRGGGTSAQDQVGAGTGLGLGSMAYQNSNDVNISGGSITGLSSLASSGNAAIGGALTVNGASLFGGPNNTFNGATTFNAPTTFAARPNFQASILSTGADIESNVPTIHLKELDAPVDQKFWRIFATDSQFILDAVNDAYSASAGGLRLTRSGYVINGYYFGSGQAQVQLNLNGVSGTSSGIFFREAGTDVGQISRYVNGLYYDQNNNNWRTQNGAVTLATLKYSNQINEAYFDISPVASGDQAFASRISLALSPTANAPVCIMSGEPGVSVQSGVIGYNWYSPDRVTPSSRVNPNIGASVIRMLPSAISFGTVAANGIINFPVRMETGNVYAIGLVIGPDNSFPRIYQNGGSHLYITSSNIIEMTVAGVRSFSLNHTTTNATFTAVSPCPSADAGLYLGLPTLRWNQIYSNVGTISTSDERNKTVQGKIGRAREMILAIEPIMARLELPIPEMPDGLPPMVKQDNRFFPMFSAQDVEKLNAFGLDLVYKDNPDSWMLNYQHFIPILWKAVKELIEAHDNN